MKTLILLIAALVYLPFVIIGFVWHTISFGFTIGVSAGKWLIDWLIG